MDRRTGELRHGTFRDLPGYLKSGDTLVLNNSRVIPARLRAMNGRTGGMFEVLLLEEAAVNDWWVMMRPGKRAQIGTTVRLMANGSPVEIEAVVTDVNEQGHRRLSFTGVENILQAAEEFGEVPLPPYIRRDAGPTTHEDRDRYQTVFAECPGSVAAPTAGLHFTPDLLKSLQNIGVKVCYVTLHVGPGTFAPAKTDDLAGHVMHEERYEISEEASAAIAEAHASAGRIVAVGTTSLRVLETAAASKQPNALAGAGRTRLFVKPPYTFQIVDALLTNFHLPRSTLLMLASAFAAPEKMDGIQIIRNAYREAVRLRYRFFSYGDAMLIV